MSITIARVDADFEREPLKRPFGFKGGYVSNLQQTAVRLESAGGNKAIGLGTQSVLWSDPDVFAGHSEAGGNALMFAVTERALQMVNGTSFETPIELLDRILGDVTQYAQQITGKPDLRQTFVLNALVPVDNAAWTLYAREHNLTQFDTLIPDQYQAALAHRHEKLACSAVVGYSMPIEEIRETVADGYFVLKTKLGQPGNQDEMLEKDKKRLSEIHNALGDIKTPYTDHGRLPYYFDANGRYREKETLQRLLDHAGKIGALDQIAILEEPFPEDYEVAVDDLEAPIAADESAHTATDTEKRIELGYSAVALKPVAKTLSMTLKIAAVAHQNDVPCFCADLTVNPILVEWNKNVAARLAPLPDLDVGLLEVNGHQNYARWDEMRSYHPFAHAPWTRVSDGIFELEADFYQKSGGILTPSPHYEELFERPDKS